MESQINVAKTFNGVLQPGQLSGGSSDSSGLNDAVQKFEAYFIQSMLKSMRSASLSSGLLDSDKSDFYRDWHDQQLASDLASKETFAVAKLLRRQFVGNSEAPATSLNTDSLFRRSPYASIGTSPGDSSNVTVVASLGTVNDDPINTTLKQLVTNKITEATRIEHKSNLSIPEQFVHHVYPYAEDAAKKLDVSADVLVAIAALETGWGLHTPKANYGQDSFNYFGIKANQWDGSAVSNVTKEFDGEKMIVIKDEFRAYETPADSFNDFAEFLLSNPRYQDAVNNSSDSKAFVDELHKAGYATDPSYAKKIHSILDGSILRNAIYTLNEVEPTVKEVSNNEINNPKVMR
jgi:flagellar protein FlgJ